MFEIGIEIVKMEVVEGVKEMLVGYELFLVEVVSLNVFINGEIVFVFEN